MVDGIELARLFQREDPNGAVYLTGMMGSVGVMVTRDEFQPEIWRLVIVDPLQSRTRSEAPLARIARPAADDWSSGEMNDDIPEDVV